ncbi:hypothetical protein [Allosphingosinicella indica]|nr:hypothetical protein [Allosphingosinicella indica]
MEGSRKRPAHLWIVGVVSALWNMIGAYDFTMTQASPDTHLAAYTASQRAWIDGFPILMEVGWGLGTVGALAGSLLLIARSRYALAAFAASLVGLLIVTLYTYGPYPPPPEMQGGAAVALNLVIWAVAIALFLYARRMQAKGVLR